VQRPAPYWFAEQDWPNMNAYAQAKTDLITEFLVLKRTN
jgi:hypothetical protein